MNAFISCDWGTSNFRLQLVNIPELSVIAKVETNEGIAGVFKSWQNSNEDRLTFYKKILSNNLDILQKQTDFKLTVCDIVISGMASSGIGMIELPYKECPVLADGSKFIVKHIKADSICGHDIYIISGIKTQDDVLRGEETMIAGYDFANDEIEQLFILPGTHSKHIVVKNKQIQSFTTFMTGEFFDLLSTKSILSVSVKKNDGIENNTFFLKGVQQAARASLLYNTFLIRTNQLIKNWDAGDNYEYLSGLLIGAELIETIKYPARPIHVISNNSLGEKYLKAIELLSSKHKTIFQNAGELLTKGQHKIYVNT